MKHRIVKKLTASLLALSLIGAGGVMGQTALQNQNNEILTTQADAATKTAGDKALIAKAKALSKKDSTTTLPNSYALYDIDGDGANEMLYIRHYNRMEVFVYRYDASKKKAKLVKTTDGAKSIGGVTSISKPASGKGFVVTLSDSAFSGGIYTYKLTKGGKLKPSIRYDYDYDKKSFTKNGKKLSQSKFEKYMAKTDKNKQISLTLLSTEKAAEEKTADTDSDTTAETPQHATSEYKSKDGWSTQYDNSVFAVNELDDGSVSFVYTGESAGTNMLTITYYTKKDANEVLQPEDILTKTMESKGWNLETTQRSEQTMPGTKDKWCFVRSLTPRKYKESVVSAASSGSFLLAAEYNDGVLLFDVDEHQSGNEELDAAFSDAIGEIFDSLTFENFAEQTEYAYIPGTYSRKVSEEIGGKKVEATFSVVLNKDHTGTLKMQDDIAINWWACDKKITDGTTEYEYAIEGDDLMLKEGNDWVTYTKEKK